MSGLRASAVRWYRRVFGAPAGSDIRDEGLLTVLDGNSAVALTEAGIAGHAVLGGSFPSGEADSVWLGEIARGDGNLFDESLAAQVAEGPRGIVAAATGLALTGRRATAFLSGPDIAAAQDLLVSAAGKHAPMVLHLGTRATPAHGGTLGNGHDSVHLSSDSGFFMLFASNVQQAIDFTAIARRTTEQSLVPGIVVMDGRETAIAAQDVRLLSPTQAQRFLGAAGATIDSPTPAQQLLFGPTRRRVPAWHDLDEPALLGALYDADSFSLGALAQKPYLDDFVEPSLTAAFERYAELTGRSHATVSKYRLDDATTVLVAVGAAVETARVAADVLRTHHKTRVGVLGIQSLRPFPVAAIGAALSGRRKVLVLERVDPLLSGEPPLTREIRAGVDRFDSGEHSPCRSVIYGVGGLPLRVTDLVRLCLGAVDDDAVAPIYLGLAFDDTSSLQPKREILLDTLRRAYPHVANLGVRADPNEVPPAQKNAVTVAIRRAGGSDASDLAGIAGALLQQLAGGRVRCRPAVSWRQGFTSLVDVLTHGDESLQDPGDGLQADIVLDTTAATVSVAGTTQTVTVPHDGDAATHSLRQETLLGALLGGMIDARLIDVKARQVLAARRQMLEGLDDDRTEALLAALQQGLDGGSADDASSADSVATADQPLDIERRTPDAVRHLARDDDHYASLPRFWDQLGSVFRDGNADGLTPDPYFATGTMPPLSSTFRDLSPMRRMLPVFDPTLCTGCGDCWTVCPDSAIGVAALRPAALLDAGIQLTGADAVRQVSGKIAARIIANGKATNGKAANGKADDADAETFGEMLDASYGWLKDKMPLPDDRKQAIGEGIARIREQLGELPVAVTEPFFHAAEAQKKDSAELLSLAINPDACKACSICVDSCEPGALSASEQDPALLQRAHTLWSAWSATPDTAGATVERAAEHAELGALPALLLSRYCQFALAGGDSAEAGSGEKIAVRQLLAATEYHQQPVVQRFANALHEAGESLTALIRETLSTTLAVDDLDAVTEQLERTSSPRVDLKTLAEGTGDPSSDHTIDTDYVLRLIDLSKQITSAHHSFVKGKHGLGRARYGVAVAGDTSTSWAATFPHNPFQAPALIDLSGDAAGLAAGLVEGQLEETTAFARLLRLARLEIEQPDGLDWQRQKLGTLRWQDLSDEEHALCPPLLLIGSDAMLAGQGLSQLIGILNSGLPVKVLLLHALDFGLASDPATVAERAPSNNSRSSLSLLALAQRNAFVAQTSVADAVHLGDSVLAALAFDGPALLQVYAPSPTRHGFDSNQTVEQALFAVQCRVLPVFRYDPGADGVFGARLDLAGNPQVAELLSQLSDDSPPASPADWALRQQRFRNCFEPLRSDAGTPLALHEWLQLESNQRRGKAPYVVSGDGDEAPRFAVRPGMLAMTEQCLATWQTLQEIAGIVTPFTARLEQDIRAEVAAEHAAELASLKQESDARVAAVQEQVEAEVASKIRSRLMDLASRKRS